MELNWINAYTTSAVSVLKSLGLNCEKGQLEIRTNSRPLSGVAILVGVVGDATGKIILDMSMDAGLKLAGRFNEETITEINDIFVATLKEFGNITCGNAMMVLEKCKINCDITTPTIILGEEIRIAEVSRSEIVIVPIITEIGTVNINIIREPKT